MTRGTEIGGKTESGATGIDGKPENAGGATGIDGKPENAGATKIGCKAKTAPDAAKNAGKTITAGAANGRKPETAGAAEIGCKAENALAATGIGCKPKTAPAATISDGKTEKAALNPVAALVVCALLWSCGGVIIKLIKWDALAIAGIRSLLGMLTLTIAFRRPPKLFVRREGAAQAENDCAAEIGGKPETAGAAEMSCRLQNAAATKSVHKAEIAAAATKIAGKAKNSAQAETISAAKRRGEIDWRATANLLLGGLFYAATMLLFVPATKMTSAANAILLQYTNPIYIIILGPLLTGEKNDWIDFAAVAGILAGMVLLLWGDLGAGQTAGNILALFSGVTYGLTTIFLRRAKNAHPSDSLNLSCLLSFLFALPFIVRAGLPQSASSYPALLCLGIFQIGMPAVLLSVGIEKVPALSSVIITMIEPMMNPVWVALFAGEVPGAASVCGGLVILAFIVAHVALKRARALRGLRKK